MTETDVGGETETEKMYGRYFLGGPCDGQKQVHVSNARPNLIGRCSSVELRTVSVYEYAGERRSVTGIEFVYRFRFTARRDAAIQFMKQNQKWQ